MAQLTVVTGNANKAREISLILGQEVVPHKLHLPELQSFELREVVEAKAKAAWEQLKTPLLVEDVSFALDVMKGFPGTFVRFWEDNVGYDVAVEIAQKLGNDRVAVSCGVGYFDGNEVLYSEGSISGRIVEKRGELQGFGFDFYFEPDGMDQTFGQMGPEVKNGISHRKQAWTAMRALLVEKGIIDNV